MPVVASVVSLCAMATGCVGDGTGVELDPAGQSACVSPSDLRGVLPPAACSDEPDERRQARFLALVDKHAPALEVVALRLCREQAAAADLLQDTLERAWRRLGSLRSEAHARGWLVRVMRNLWLDQLRRRHAEVPLEEASEVPVATSDEPSWWQLVTAAELRAAIEQLREPYRSVAVLHDLDGHSYREVARLLDILPVTAATRLHRAHLQIRALLRDGLGE